MTNLQYLPGIVPFTFGLYLIVVVPIYYKFASGITPNPGVTPLQLFFEGKDFPITYHSWWKGYGTYLLLIWRLLCFGYFFGVVFWYGYIREGFANAFYFTLWNIDLISLYYGLSLTASIIGVVSEAQAARKAFPSLAPVTWSLSATRLGYAVQIVFEFAGATAFFITLVNFAALNPVFSFWNVCYHFATSISFVGELLLNQLPVRWEHAVFQVSWALLYLMFCWPMVGAGVLPDWPYFFLRTGSATVFLEYTGLIVLDVLFYYLFFGIAKWKEIVLDPVQPHPQSEPDNPVVHGTPEIAV